MSTEEPTSPLLVERTAELLEDDTTVHSWWLDTPYGKHYFRGTTRQAHAWFDRANAGERLPRLEP